MKVAIAAIDLGKHALRAFSLPLTALTLSLIPAQDTSGLARDGGASVTIMLDVPPLSRASPLPQVLR